MEINENYLPIERLRQIMEVLDPCMDDFLFILNMRTGFYEISPSAVTRFNIPSDEYFFTSEALSRQVYYKDLPMLINDLEGTGSKAYEIKQAAIANRCTVVEELVFCHYYNQAPFFIASLSESIYVRCLHLPDPKDEREAAIAKRIADEADFYGIELRFDAAELIERYDGQNINDDLTFSN